MASMDIDETLDNNQEYSEHVVVIPGEEITIEQGYLRGHGTYVRRNQESDDGSTDLVASVTGVVERVNKLISVRPLRARYGGDVGDIIIGRVSEVGAKRWKVDVNARQEAVLMLGSVNLPGGAQRRRTLEDQLQMRQLFQENDLISAEVSQFYSDGALAIHTRSLKYGKLENGVLVRVAQALIKRLKQHFVTLSCDVDAILAKNGYIWLTETPPSQQSGATAATTPTGKATKDTVGIHDRGQLIESIEEKKKFISTRLITHDARERIARVRNAILILADAYMAIHPESIMQVYNTSVANGLHPKQMLSPDVAAGLREAVLL